MASLTSKGAGCPLAASAHVVPLWLGATLAILMTGSPLLGQVLDPSWSLTVNGRTVQANPGGSFRIANVSAADSFGAGGPGTPPDFRSDDFLRLVGTRSVDGRTEYVFSEPFQIRQGQTFRIGGLTFTDVPPPQPRSIQIEVPSDFVVLGSQLPLTVIGVLADGSEKDLSPQTSWTIYRTSNSSVASVDENGLVIGRAAGAVFVTAVNEGATATKLLIITEEILDTTVEGFVQLPDGAPADGANIHGPFGSSAVADASGHFTFGIELPSEIGSITVIARADDGTPELGASPPVPPIDNGITDMGLITVQPNTDTFFADSRSSSGSGSSPLTPGEQYLVQVQGTYSEWETNDWRSFNNCGTREGRPIFPSSGGSNQSVGLDAQYIFATPDRRCRFSQMPHQTNNLALSTNGGSSWTRVSALDTEFSAEHSYVFMIVGGGFPLRGRTVGEPRFDNYGRLRVGVFGPSPE